MLPHMYHENFSYSVDSQADAIFKLRELLAKNHETDKLVAIDDLAYGVKEKALLLLTEEPFSLNNDSAEQILSSLTEWQALINDGAEKGDVNEDSNHEARIAVRQLVNNEIKNIITHVEELK